MSLRFLPRWPASRSRAPRLARLHVSVADEPGQRVRAVVAPSLPDSPKSVMAPIHETD